MPKAGLTTLFEIAYQAVEYCKSRQRSWRLRQEYGWNSLLFVFGRHFCTVVCSLFGYIRSQNVQSCLTIACRCNVFLQLTITDTSIFVYPDLLFSNNILNIGLRCLSVRKRRDQGILEYMGVFNKLCQDFGTSSFHNSGFVVWCTFLAYDPKNTS